MADISQVKLPNGQTYNLKDALLRNHLGDFEESSNCFPYTLRPTCDGKTDIGDRAYLDKIVGGTVAWNQLNDILTIGGDTSDLTFTFGKSGATTIVGTSNKADFKNVRKYVGLDNHKLLYMANPAFPEGLSLGPTYNTNARHYKFDITSGDKYLRFVFQNGVTLNYSGYVCTFDLTQMFGTTIANYIYSLETATPGAGVAWFRKLFPKDYYEYNPGELISVSGVSARESVGFNLFDLSRFAKEYPNFCAMSGDELTVNSDGVLFSKGVDVNIPVDMAGGYITYEVKCGTATNFRMRIVYASGTIKDIGGTSATSWQTVTRQLDTGRIMAIRLNWTNAGTFYIRNLCINLSWSGERNGEYEPYVKHSYPLDSTLTLRGIPKLDSNNQLYYDGDEYLPDGTVNRRYGVVDLGTLNWAVWSLGGTPEVKHFYTRPASLTPAKKNGEHSPMFCKLYVMNLGAYNVSSFNDKTMMGNPSNQEIRIRDDSFNGDVAAFKAAMSGVYLVYELANNTTETADPYLPVMPIDKWGIESFVTSGIVPIGHKTRYVAKLDNLPSLAGGDGYYIIDQTGDKMSLSPITETHIPDLNASKITGGTLSADRLPISGVTAGSYGPSGNQSPVHGGTFSVPSITADAKGRVTSASTKTVTLPTYPTYSAATSSADGLMSATDKSKLDSMTTVPLASGLNMTEGTDGLIFTYVS